MDIKHDITYIVRPNTNKPVQIGAIDAGFSLSRNGDLPSRENCQEVIKELDGMIRVLRRTN